jgi:hypothetical protein
MNDEPIQEQKDIWQASNSNNVRRKEKLVTKGNYCTLLALKIKIRIQDQRTRVNIARSNTIAKSGLCGELCDNDGNASVYILLCTRFEDPAGHDCEVDDCPPLY